MNWCIYSTDTKVISTMASASDRVESIPEVGVVWDAGLVEDMRQCGLTDKTIQILGEEEYTTYNLIDFVDEQLIAEELKDLGIKSGQRLAFLSLKKARQQKRVEGRMNKTFMTERHHDLLLKCKPKMADCMDPVRVLEILQSEKILTDHEREAIKSKTTRYDQVTEMLDCLMKSTDDGFWHLVRALYRTKQDNLVNLIREKMTSEGKST